MNSFGIEILIAFIIAFICSIYLYTGRRLVNKIMKRENKGLYKNLNNLQDVKSLYNTFKNNKEISTYERKFLKQYFIIYILSIFLILVLCYLFFGTNW